VQCYAVYLFLAEMTPASLALESILPPLLSLFAIYITLRSFYRTGKLLFRSTWFLLKWGTLIGIILWIFGAGGDFIGEAVYGPGYQGQWRGQWRVGDYLDSFLMAQGRAGASSRSNTRSARQKRPSRVDQPPSIFDSFQEHTAYANRRQKEARKAARVASQDSPIDEVLDQIRDTWTENGKELWNTFGRMAGFTEDLTDSRNTRDSQEQKVQKGRTRTTR